VTESTEPPPEPHEELAASGRRLVEALTAQLADGQVETLYSLQTAAAQVRRHTSAVTTATDSLADSLRGLTDKVAADVQQGFHALLREAHTSIGEQLAAEVDAGSTELRAGAQDHATLIAAQLEATSTHLAALYDGAVARTEDARQGLEWVARQGAEQLTAAATSLKEHRTEGEAALAAAGAQASEQIRTAVSEALQLLRDGVRDLLGQAAAAREEMDSVLLDARKAAEEELIALRKQIQVAEHREEAVAERLQGHVEQLVARTDATVAASLTHLRGVADALLERDAQLEKRRTDEFARVLETVLREGGASTRKLRDRILRGMDKANQPSPVPVVGTATEVPAAEPTGESAAPAVPPEPTRPAKATAKRAPAKAPAKKAPAKRAAAKKAAPDVTSTSLQEEQA
jgi:heparin binding hemagglutinin HbhA